MRVLVVTLLYKNYNYGAILQAYALRNTLKAMGHECIELAYDKDYRTKLDIIRLIVSKSISAFILPKDFWKLRINSTKQKIMKKKYHCMFPNNPMESALDRFICDEFVCTQPYNKTNIHGIEEYDVYISGGDQVWNPTWTDDVFFLSFTSKKKIAYSCSVGKDCLTKHEKDDLIRRVVQFDYLSVREKDVYEILLQSGIDCEIVSDPVFLLEKEEWCKFANTGNNIFLIDKPYIFVYLLGEDKKKRECVKEFAKMHNMRIAFIPHIHRRYNKYDENFADYCFMDVGPKEFLELLSGASFVLTDSFHGTAFSIIMHKQFFCFGRYSGTDRRSMNSRLYTLLNEYQLLNYMIEVDELKSGVNYTCIDYTNVENMIKQKRIKAKSFLDKSVNSI